MPTKKGFTQGRRGAGMRLAALIVLQALCAGTAWPQQPAGPQSSDELAKQEQIYRSQGKSVPGGYITGRSLGSYRELLPSGFSATLNGLGPKDRWLDIGAGGGHAILDYYAREYNAAKDGKLAPHRARARAVAVSIEDRRSDRWKDEAEKLGDDRIRYLFGKRLREYTNEELGKFQLITDVYGGFSYTDNLSLFMEKVLGFLAVRGSFFTMVQSVHLQDHKDNPRTWYLTDITDASDRNVTVCAWLKNISCVKVTCESKSAWDTPTELIRVRKVCDGVRVPPLKATGFEAGQPPERHFRIAP